jgi:hypothetical protein
MDIIKIIIVIIITLLLINEFSLSNNNKKSIPINFDPAKINPASL